VVIGYFPSEAWARYVGQVALLALPEEKRVLGYAVTAI
jgi:hypothetical protein